MQHKKVGKELLAEKAFQLFSERGYFSTSMENIANACNIEKSSLYHHIASRSELLMMILNYRIKIAKEYIVAVANQSELTAVERLNKIAKMLEESFLQNNYYCLLPNLMTEGNQHAPEIIELIRETFNCLISPIAHILKEINTSSTQAQELAEDTIAQMYGAVVLSKVYNTPHILKRAMNKLSQLVSSLDPQPVG